MNTKGVFVVLALLATGASNGYSQSVLSSSGGAFSNGTRSITFTIGEPVTVTYAQATVIATQGFNQPEDDFTTAVAVVVEPNVQVSVWPNPTRDEVTVHVSGVTEPVTLELFDAVGRSVSHMAHFIGNTVLDLRSHANGTYYARITADGRYLTTVQLCITQ